MNLNNNFIDFGIKCLSIGEGKAMNINKYWNAVVVPKEYSNPGIGDYVYLKNYNHIECCKPENEEDVRYKLILNFIQECLKSMNS